MIIYIGFSTKTHKIMARIFCRHFKHCAPVIVKKNRCEIYQFTKPNKITTISVNKHDIKILKKYGWIFIRYPVKNTQRYPSNIRAITCVQFTKKFCGIKKVSIQTPDELLKYLTKK